MHLSPITSSRAFDQENMEATHYKGLHTKDMDYRTNLYDLKSIELPSASISKIEAQANSVACLINERWFSTLNDGAMQLDPAIPTLAKHIERTHNTALGERENFLNEPAVASCTAFLVANKLILTAAHNVCDATGTIDKKKLDTLRVVFGFRMISGQECQRRFTKENVYSMKDVVAYQFIQKINNYQDWALIKLDRKVVNRTPLQMDFNKKVVDNTLLYMLGYPMGLPIKYTRNGYVKKSDHPNVFKANLDAFSGNSGSPILDLQGMVIGILSRGSDDYEKVDSYKGTGNTKMQAYCINESTTLTYEICQKITSLFFVNYYLYSHKDLDLSNHLEKEKYRTFQYCLGQCYAKGDMVIQNHTKAFECFKKAAALGLNDALYECGMSYLNGRGIEQDEQLALICLKETKDPKFSAIIYNFGMDYLKGLSGTKDEIKAHKYLQCAADLGHIEARDQLPFLQGSINAIRHFYHVVFKELVATARYTP